jgi:hypothetical protein
MIVNSLIFGTFISIQNNSYFHLNLKKSANSTTIYFISNNQTQIIEPLYYNKQNYHINAFNVVNKDAKRHFVLRSDYVIIEKEKVDDFSFKDEFYFDSNNQLAEIAIIVDEEEKSEENKKVIKYWKQFKNKLFPYGHHFKIFEWPPIWTRKCPSNELQSKLHRGKERSIALIHHQIWLDFYRRYSKKINKLYTEVIVILEEDAYCNVKNCGEVILKEVSRMKTDVLYFGWCFGDNNLDGKDLHNPPACTHAYAITLSGAKILLDEVDPCGEALDIQIQNLGARDWKFTSQLTRNYNYTVYYEKNGFSTQGLFTQQNISLLP